MSEDSFYYVESTRMEADTVIYTIVEIPKDVAEKAEELNEKIAKLAVLGRHLRASHSLPSNYSKEELLGNIEQLISLCHDRDMLVFRDGDKFREFKQFSTQGKQYYVADIIPKDQVKLDLPDRLRV